MLLRSRRSTLRAIAFVGVIALACVAIVVSAWRPEQSPPRLADPVSFAPSRGQKLPNPSPTVIPADVPAASARVEAGLPTNSENAIASAPKISGDDVARARDQGYALIASWQR